MAIIKNFGGKMKYFVEIKETLTKVVEIEANNAEEALDVVEKQYKNSEIILVADDYVNTEMIVKQQVPM